MAGSTWQIAGQLISGGDAGKNCVQAMQSEASLCLQADEKNLTVVDGALSKRTVRDFRMHFLGAENCGHENWRSHGWLQLVTGS